MRTIGGRPRRVPGPAGPARLLLWVSVLVLLLTVLPGGLGAVAMAQDGRGAAVATSRMDGIAWMNIQDSAGVQLADYTFVGDPGGLPDPGSTVLYTLVGLEFVGYLVIVATAIWFIGYALSFDWLDLFADALRTATNAFADRIATPAVLLTAATIGAFFVAWFVIRGFYSRAVVQVCTMLAVAVLGPLFLAEPLAGVLDSDGLLARGRDVGMTIAAGLDGSAAGEPALLVRSVQGELADNFARGPVQVWNFGHVLDDGCATAWSAGMNSGDTERIRRALGACGDAAAVARAHPRPEQLGTGLVLLVSAAALLLFAVVLAVRVIRAALDTVYQAFLAIFGFAAGGFVYGPSQTFLVRNLVNSAVAAARMCAYTVFIGVYLLFLGNLFEQARGQVVAVLVAAAAVEIVAIFQLGRLARSLTRGSVWAANRFALAVQGVPARAGGVALGAGGAGGGSAGGSGQGMLTTLAALNTVNSSPLTAWVAGRTLTPLSPLAVRRMRTDRASIASAESRLEEHLWRAESRQNWRLLARQEADAWGGIDTELGLSRALKYLRNNGVPAQSVVAALHEAGASHERIQDHFRARQVRNDTRSRNTYGFAPLYKAIAAGNAVLNHAGTAAEPAFAAQAVSDADSLARHTRRPGPAAQLDHGFIARVQRYWNSDRDLRANIAPEDWQQAGTDTRRAIARRLATEHLAVARAYAAAPTEANRAELAASLARMANVDQPLPQHGPGPWDV